MAPKTGGINLRDILFRTFPHSLLDPADLRAVSRHLGRCGRDAYKRQHFLAAEAWLDLFEGAYLQATAARGLIISQTAALRIGIQRRKNQTVKRLLHVLAEAVIRATRRHASRSVRCDPGSADEQRNRLGSLNWAARADPAFVGSARRWIHQQYLPALPGAISQFCYFADSWCPTGRAYRDQVLASRFGEEAADVVQREALWASLPAFLEAPVTCMFAELKRDPAAAAWLGPQVMRACHSEFPQPIAILAASKVELLFSMLRT